MNTQQGSLRLLSLFTSVSYLYLTLFLFPVNLPAEQTPLPMESAVVETYSRLVYLNYSRAYHDAQVLLWSIGELLSNPIPQTLEKAKRIWLKARESYSETEAFRFYEGPIDFYDPETKIEGPEGRLNSWPLNEAYIDYVEGNPNSGLVNNLQVSMTTDLITDSNQQNDEADVSTGYHAIEFLLWGQDLSPKSAGSRPFTDFESGDQIKNRRRQHLKVVTEQLVADLEFLMQSWHPNRSNNYATQFRQMPTQVALGKILTGLATLSGFELSSERMAIPLDSGDQEDEHSCFSDSTHQDFIFNAKGIRNVYFGRYGGFEGTGINRLVEVTNSELNHKLSQNLQQTQHLIKQIPFPIDREVLSTPAGSSGRQQMEKAIIVLLEQSQLFQTLGQALNVNVTVVSD